jgi:hypothetical protein
MHPLRYTSEPFASACLTLPRYPDTHDRYMTVCLFRCTYLSALAYIASTGECRAHFHALPLLLQYSACASMTLPHHRCDRPSFTVFMNKVLLSLTAVDYCCTYSELPLSIDSLTTQNCACLKGVMSAGAQCSCPSPNPLRCLYISRGHKSGHVFATL